MSDFQNYVNAQTEKKLAYEMYCHAGDRLKLAQIKERFHEIQSQYDPLNELLIEIGHPEDSQIRKEIRDKLINLVKYVVVGR